MIDINLIPTALRKSGQGKANTLTINIPKEIMLGVGSAVILFLLTVHLILGAVWLSGTLRLAGYKANWDKLIPDKKVLDVIYDESKDLKKRISVVSDMTVKKSVLWAPKFNAISDALPKGLWLRRMTLDNTGLVMDGSVVSKSQSEISNVGNFILALKLNDAFIKDFSSLEVNSIQRGKNNTVEVTDFTVMAKSK